MSAGSVSEKQWAVRVILEEIAPLLSQAEELKKTMPVAAAELRQAVASTREVVQATGNEEVNRLRTELSDAVNSAKELIEQNGLAQKNIIQNYTAQERAVVRADLKQAIHDDAGKVLANLASAVTNSVGVHRWSIQEARQQSWKMMGICIVVSVAASALSLYAAHHFYGKELKQEANVGRAVGAVWDKFDAKTKASIQAEMKKI